MSATTAGQNGIFTKRTLNGKSYLVAPVTAIREGVYLYPRANGNGIKREFLPAEEIANTADEWEDEEITLNHPEDDEGRPGLIRDNNTTHTEIGFFRDVVNNDDKLGGKVWIEVDEIGEHNGELEAEINRGKRGQPIEVSTGYAAATEYSRGEYQNQRYTYVQREPEPDHLALLTNDKGNCSVDDGCGVGKKPNLRPVEDGGTRVNHRAILNVRNNARTPEFNGTETSDEQPWADVPKTLSYFADELGINYEGDSPTVESLTREERSEIAGLTLLGSVDADTTRELMMFPVVNPGNMNLNEGALNAVMSARGQSADIPDSAYESAVSKAESMKNENFGDNDRENATIVSATFEVEGEVDPDKLDDVVAKLNVLEGVRVHRTPSNFDPKIHVVAFPMKTDAIVDYRMAFERAFKDSPFGIEGEFDGPLAELPGGGNTADVQNVGRHPGNAIGYVDEGTDSTVSDTIASEVRRLRATVNKFIGNTTEEPTGDTVDDENKENGSTTDETMENREKLINEITESSEIKPESLEAMGDTCLEVTHANIVTENDDEGEEETEKDVTNEKVEELESEVEELRSTVNELNDELEAEKREKEEQLNERLIEESDLAEETVQNMSLEAKKDVLDEFTEETNSQEQQTNMAGMPHRANMDEGSDELSEDIPVAGERGETGGDD